MERTVATIGFGEAARAFAQNWRLSRPLRAYDLKSDDPAQAPAIEQACGALGANCYASAAEALRAADVVLSLVTADGALAAARDAARLLQPGALWCDMNSVASKTKRIAAELIEAAGARYVDVAVMSPVEPARRGVPLLVSGPHTGAAVEALNAIGFTSVRAVAGSVGAASSIKIIRSVMVKGLEALSAEMILAAEAAGVRDEVIASLNASWPGTDWAAKADYNLERMMVHGLRRAAEMEEVEKTLDALGTGAAMTRGTIERQRAIGHLGMEPPATLQDKIDAILGRRKEQAA